MQILKYLQQLITGVTDRSVAPESSGGLPHENISVEQIADPESIHIPECAITLSDYVKHESVSGNEGAAGQFFADFCRSKGLHVEIFTRENDSFNFAASLYPLTCGKPNIVLLNHIDVVPAEDFQRWTYPPFSGIIADGHVWGRGSYDSKGLGVMQLYAVLKYLKRAKNKELPYNVTVLCVSGEETGGEKGAGIVSEVFLEQLNPVVVYGEGGAGIKGASQAFPERPFFGITTSQKRILWWEMRSEIPATGHGSVPTGDNATLELIAAVHKVLEKKPPLRFTPISKNMLRVLGRNDQGIRGFVLRNIGLFSRLIGNTLRKEPLIAALLTDSTSLLGIYSTPGAANQIASVAKARFDSRLLPETTNEEFLAKIKRLVKRYHVEIDVIRQFSPSMESQTGYYFDAFKDAVLRSYDDAVALPIIFVAHDDNYYFRRKNIPTYGLVPIILEKEIMSSLHNVNERMPIAILEKGIDVYSELLHILLDVRIPESKPRK